MAWRASLLGATLEPAPPQNKSGQGRSETTPDRAASAPPGSPCTGPLLPPRYAPRRAQILPRHPRVAA
eukprot:9121404-Pyramimonas_sp.AAC.1